MRLLVTALKELFWLYCLMWRILFMIAAATEGFPFISIHIRDEFWRDAIGGLGLFLAVVGVYLGFAVGKTKRADDATRTSCPINSSSAKASDTPLLAGSMCRPEFTW
jgi:hypothetical protein